VQIKLPLQWILSIWKAHIGFQQICNYYSGNAPVWEFPETLVTSIGKFPTETKVRFRKVTDIAEAYSRNSPSAHPTLSKSSSEYLRKRERIIEKLASCLSWLFRLSSLAIWHAINSYTIIKNPSEENRCVLSQFSAIYSSKLWLLSFIFICIIFYIYTYYDK